MRSLTENLKRDRSSFPALRSAVGLGGPSFPLCRMSRVRGRPAFQNWGVRGGSAGYSFSSPSLLSVCEEQQAQLLEDDRLADKRTVQWSPSLVTAED